MSGENAVPARRPRMLELARDRSCDTLEVRLGLDGTILQRLPLELESDRDSTGQTKTCTLRFWPAALH